MAKAKGKAGLAAGTGHWSSGLILLVAAGACSICSPRALADDAALPAVLNPPAGDGVVGTPAIDEPNRGDAHNAARETLRFDHWENALDVKLTTLFNHNASDIGSPALMLTAEWNRHFTTETYAGITLSGVPQQANAATNDGSTKTYSTYYGGIDVAQTIYKYRHMRLAAMVSGGLGVVYVRMTPYGSTSSTVDRPNYTFVEPGGYLTLYDWHDIEFGITMTYRMARLQTNVASTSNADISSAAYGLTMRSLMH